MLRFRARVRVGVGKFVERIWEKKSQNNTQTLVINAREHLDPTPASLSSIDTKKEGDKENIGHGHASQCALYKSCTTNLP
jgi:hypothetical protein